MKKKLNEKDIKANPLVDPRLRPNEKGEMEHFLKLGRGGGKTISNEIYDKGFMDGIEHAKKINSTMLSKGAYNRWWKGRGKGLIKALKFWEKK